MGLGLKRMNFGGNKNEGLKNKKRIKEKCQKRREGLKDGREKRDFFFWVCGVGGIFGELMEERKTGRNFWGERDI